MKTRTISTAAALFAAVLLAGGAVAPAMASSDPKSQSAQAQRNDAKGSTEPLYCVVERPTGSHIRTKDCRTRAQ